MIASGETMTAEMALHLRALLDDLFEVHDVTVSRNGVLQLRGRLRRPAEETYPLAAKRLEPLEYTPVLRRQGGDDIVIILPGLPKDTDSRPWLGPALFGLTVLSMLFVGAINSGWMPGLSLPVFVLQGLPFTLTLLAILTAHELGHYFVGRHYGVPISLPYFIPMPFSIFGTMGAFIRLKAPPTNRKVLLAIAVAGPLSGLAVAVPLLLIGLKLSELGPIVPANVIQEGNSLLYLAAKYVVFGHWLPGGGLDVYLHPMAFAAWAGIFVTALNLVPAGQLDGGHAIYALIGERARYLTMALIVALVALGLAWPGWFLWAALLFFLGRTFATPLDDITRLDGRRIALAVVMLVAFVLTFTPIPLVQR